MKRRSFWRLARRVATAASVLADALVDAAERRLIDAGMAEALRRSAAEYREAAKPPTVDEFLADPGPWSCLAGDLPDHDAGTVDDAELDVRHLHGDVVYPSSRSNRREWIA